VRRAYKLRAYPTRPQEGRAALPVRVNQHRPVVGRVKTLQLKREGRRWYVIVVTQTDPVRLPPTGREVGVDLGVARFLTTSDGAVVVNPRFLDADLNGACNIATRAGLGSGQASAA
jgi:transposase